MRRAAVTTSATSASFARLEGSQARARFLLPAFFPRSLVILWLGGRGHVLGMIAGGIVARTRRRQHGVRVYTLRTPLDGNVEEGGSRLEARGFIVAFLGKGTARGGVQLETAHTSLRPGRRAM